MAETPIWAIKYRGVGELGQPVNLITEETAESVETALKWFDWCRTTRDQYLAVTWY